MIRWDFDRDMLGLEFGYAAIMIGISCDWDRICWDWKCDKIGTHWNMLVAGLRYAGIGIGICW
jgi:hypothetical protein